MHAVEHRRLRFERIADEVFEPLQRYLRRRADPEDAQDALSDVLLTVWRRLDSVPSDAVLPWCYGVARRVLANQRRGARRRQALIERVAPSDVGHTDVPDHPEVTAALAALADADREVLSLWAWERLEPRDIAIALGITPNAATQRLAKAKKRLARQISRHDLVRGGHEHHTDTGSTP